MAAIGQKVDELDEFDAMFASIVVPATIVKPKTTKKKDDSIEGMRLEKIEKINDWILKLESGEARKTGKEARSNLSNLTVDSNFVSLKLSHGPGGNMNLYFKGEWKPDHIIPTSIEVSFWKATIKLFEAGRYDAELEALKKKVHGAFYDENGVRKPRKVKKSKSATDEIVIG